MWYMVVMAPVVMYVVHRNGLVGWVLYPTITSQCQCLLHNPMVIGDPHQIPNFRKIKIN